jgi:hypothetical protein
MPSDIQAWVKGLELAPATVGVVHGIASTVMKAAIRDRRIASNPCDGTKLPKVQRKQIVPLTTEQVGAVRDALPPQLMGTEQRAFDRLPLVGGRCFRAAGR